MLLFSVDLCAASSPTLSCHRPSPSLIDVIIVAKETDCSYSSDRKLTLTCEMS